MRWCCYCCAAKALLCNAGGSAAAQSFGGADVAATVSVQPASILDFFSCKSFFCSVYYSVRQFSATNSLARMTANCHQHLLHAVTSYSCSHADWHYDIRDACYICLPAAFCTDQLQRHQQQL
jgi:hypothetical protein